MKSKNESFDNDQDLLRPCCIQGCDRYGTRLLSSLRDKYSLKQGHSGRVCEGHYRRDLRAYKRSQSNSGTKHLLDARKHNLYSTCSPPRIIEEPTTPTNSVRQEVEHSEKDKVGSNASYCTEVVENSQESGYSSLMDSSSDEKELSVVDSVDPKTVVSRDEIFMEVDDEIYANLYDYEEECEDFCHSEWMKFKNKRNSLDVVKFKTFCNFILSNQGVIC
ncbi:hypothetical protein AKO1_007414 [Acrasis kona]|uniref:Uncharacterized protein n=1 Tax=Acrasis kona TaxID=1008807 RepID=A0AAW2YUH0_9EUKA